MKTTTKTNHALRGLIPGPLLRALFAPLLAIAALFAAPAAARAGLMYVSTGGGPIHKVTSSAVVSLFATVDSPTGLAFDSSENLYAAEVNIDRISKITPGAVVSTFATLPGFPQKPNGLAIDSGGNLYTANAQPDTISKITIGGVVSTFATIPGGGFLAGLAFDSSGNLYVADVITNQISKITSGGTVSLFATVTSATGLAFDGSGDLYAASSTNTISRITPGGTVSLFATLPGGSNPLGLAFDEIGNLYAANQSANTISKITSGGVVTTFATGITNPRFIAFAVPEPGTALFGLACLGVAALRRRRPARNASRSDAGGPSAL